MSTERRRAPRAQILGRLHGRIVTVDTRVQIREISLGGMSLESEIAFPVGAVHQFELFLGDGASVAVSAQARHSRRVDDVSPMRYLTGFQFIEDDPSADGRVTQLVTDLS
jgi:hypothetical protein